MALISLICLLAVSSSAFGRSTYGTTQYSESPRAINLPLTKVEIQTPIAVQPTFVPQGNGYSSNSYGKHLQKSNQGMLFDQQIQTQPQQLTQADILCQGQRPETILPLDEGRRFIVCLEDGKGTEQFCPRGLHFHQETRRCERRLGVLDNACLSNPCLNDGQCFPTDTSSYQCKCAAGFDGTNCELDARICQTQQPCGLAQGTRCQSFRTSAALQFVCIHQNEHAYGFSAQQVTPSPCRNIDGAQPLGISEKGFVMCDGERMFVESCPGGTIWDDSTKACVWPDMQGYSTTIRLNEQIKPTGYGQQTTLLTSSYESQVPSQRLNVENTLVQPSQYGGSQKLIQKLPEMIQTPVSSYGSQQFVQKPQEFGQQTIQSPQEFVQRPQEFVQKPQEFVQQTIQRPQEFIQKPQEFVQQTIQRPQEFIQKPQEFVQQTIQRPQEFIQKPQEFVQQPMQKMQDFLPSQSQSYGGQQQTFSRIQRQPEFRSVQQTSSY